MNPNSTVSRSKTYEALVRCTNCGAMVTLQIPKGTTEEDYLAKNKNMVCPNCGCNPSETGGYI
jgi:transcription elongation factor Elf1